MKIKSTSRRMCRLAWLGLWLGLVQGPAWAQLIAGLGTGLTADASTVALFHFEDPATTALDSTAAMRNATVEGTTVGTGLFGSGRSFDGGDDRLELNHAFTALSGSSAWTIEYFAKSADGSSVPYLVNHNASAGWYLFPANGYIGYGVKTTWDGNSWNVLTSVTAPALDTGWHYYALTFTAYGSLSVYRDGALLGASGTFGSWSGSNSSGAYLDYDTYWASFGGAGTIDDLRFSSVARSGLEIQSTYNLAAVPEPSVYALLATGGAGLIALRRRRETSAGLMAR